MVEIVAFNPLWKQQFLAEREVVCSAFGAGLVSLHHIGSTAIEGAHAKPVIDILAVACSIEAIDVASPALAALGYRAMGSYGIEGRRYFRKDDCSGRRTHQLHGYAATSSEIERHLAFRDYLNAHPAKALAYSELKQRLVAEDEDYVAGKAPFVQAIQADALVWYRRQPRGY